MSAKLRVRSWFLSFAAAENLGVFVDAVGLVLFYFILEEREKEGKRGRKRRKKKKKGKRKW